ncbi:hypothetical protein AB5I41_07855 [Sphingomonas sp. MMS24-JH45]
MYIFRDRGLTREFVARAKAARYDGLVLTVHVGRGQARTRHRQRAQPSAAPDAAQLPGSRGVRPGLCRRCLAASSTS